MEPRVFADSRGTFRETYNKEASAKLGLLCDFVQDNCSISARNVLRGLHYQLPFPQGKLIWVAQGEVFDVAVDLRRRSPTFRQWKGFTLSEDNRFQLFLPPGIAHGFCVVSERAIVVYKCTEFYRPDCEQTLLWSDPNLAIPWPISQPILSSKDRNGLLLDDAPCFEDMTC